MALSLPISEDINLKRELHIVTRHYRFISHSITRGVEMFLGQWDDRDAGGVYTYVMNFRPTFVPMSITTRLSTRTGA